LAAASETTIWPGAAMLQRRALMLAVSPMTV
jgi:hypothetical protein